MYEGSRKYADKLGRIVKRPFGGTKDVTETVENASEWSVLIKGWRLYIISA